MSIQRFALTGLLLAFVATARAEEPFVNKTFEEACTQAEKDGKMVLIDFYTTWCAPCKKLDKETWPDADVKRLLADKFVSIKLDAEKDTKTAAKYKVNAYPTILLVKADGKEYDRITGFRSAEDMVGEIKDALAGKDSVERARKKAVGGKNSASARMHVGKAFKDKGQYDKALEEYMWCFDHGLENDRAFYGVRLSFLLSYIMELGKEYPPAVDALKKRRDDAGAFVLDFDAKKAGPKPPLMQPGRDPLFEKIHDFTSLNKTLNDQESNLKLFDSLRQKKPKPDPQAMAKLFDAVLTELVEARRYQDVAEHVTDPAAEVSKRIEEFKERGKAMAQVKFPGMEEFMERQMVEFVDELCHFYECMVGAKKLDEANRVATTILDFNNAPRTFEALAKRALRAKGKAAAAPIVARAKKDLSAAEFARIQPTLDRIPEDD